jgi:hypothetical protein
MYQVRPMPKLATACTPCGYCGDGVVGPSDASPNGWLCLGCALDLLEEPP